MIQVTKILDGDKVIGVGITINGEPFFISTDQDFFPGIRSGTHPRDTFGGAMVAFPEDVILQVETKQ